MNELIKLIKGLFGEDQAKVATILVAIVAVGGLVSMTTYFSAISVPMWEATIIDWLKHTLHIALYVAILYWTAGIAIATDIVNIEARRIEEQGEKADAKFLAINKIFWLTTFISQSAFMAFWYPIMFGDKLLIGSILHNAYVMITMGIYMLNKIIDRIEKNNINKARIIESMALAVSVAIFFTYIIKEESGITRTMFIANTLFLGVFGTMLARAGRQDEELMRIMKTYIAITSIIIISGYFGGLVYEEIPSRMLGGMPISAEVETRGKFSRLGNTTEIIHETKSHIYLQGKDGKIIRIPQSEVISVKTRKDGQESQEEENSGETKHLEPKDKLQSKALPIENQGGVPKGSPAGKTEQSSLNHSGPSPGQNTSTP